LALFDGFNGATLFPERSLRLVEEVFLVASRFLSELMIYGGCPHSWTVTDRLSDRA
jgi:hypothetical protein